MTEHPQPGGRTAPDLDELRALLLPAAGGDQAVLPRLRELLDATGVWRQLGDLSAHARMSWIGHIAGDDLGMKEMLGRKVGELKAELGGPAPSALERLLVDRVVACWLVVHHEEIEAAGVRDDDPKRAGLALKRQAHAQRRYAAAITALATVRRLLPSSVVAPRSTRPGAVATKGATRKAKAPGEGREKVMARDSKDAPGLDGDGTEDTARVVLFESGPEAR